MEIVWRSVYHSVLVFLKCTTSFVNIHAYKCNIKRMRVILTNDYGRVSNSEEVQSDDEGSCSMATEIVSIDDLDDELREFECPGYEEGEPGDIADGKSDGSQISEESRISGIPNDSHGSKSKVH
jgi:hypothetical protein